MKYEIKGETLPVVICNLNKGETMITESGGMSWMSENIAMETTSNGGFGAAFGRMVSGESLFINKYTCQGENGMIAFSSSMPGSILAFDITPTNEIIAQKTAFLAAENSVNLSVFFNKKMSGGIFGGEGFIMQKLSGNGTAFLEIDGHVEKYHLDAGQKMIVDTGHLAAMTSTVNLEVKSIKGFKNVLFGGEGLFNTVLTGPGDVWLQTMPIASLAGRIIPYIPSK